MGRLELERRAERRRLPALPSLDGAPCLPCLPCLALRLRLRVTVGAHRPKVGRVGYGGAPSMRSLGQGGPCRAILRVGRGLRGRLASQIVLYHIDT